MKFNLNITKQKIKQGEPSHPNTCPVALAWMSDRRVDSVWVSGDASEVHFRYRNRDVMITVEHPDSLREVISQYDETQEMSPFKLEIEFPSECFYYVDEYYPTRGRTVEADCVTKM